MAVQTIVKIAATDGRMPAKVPTTVVTDTISPAILMGSSTELDILVLRRPCEL